LPIRLIAIDLDDTLLRHDLTISERTLHAVNTAIEKGVMVTVATGRMPLSCQKFIHQLGICMPVITCHGAIIRDMKKGETIYRKTIDNDIAVQAVKIMQSEGMHCQIYLQDKIYTNKQNTWAETWKKLTAVQAEEADLLKVLEQKDGPEKIISIDAEELIYQKYQAYQKMFYGKIHLTLSKPMFLEMSDAAVNKGSALEILARMHHIQRDEIMAIGDSLNDLEMIQFAGKGVAMGNGRPEVKMVADYITATNDEDGAAEAIEKFVLSEDE